MSDQRRRSKAASRSTLPAVVWTVRHGQSAGNVARDLAEANGHQVIDIADRDVDVPLSEAGVQQAEALAHWFGSMGANERPQVILYSPYVRARQTATCIFKALRDAGEHVSFRSDERLREKEFGVLDRLTVAGIKQRHRELSEQRSHVGKFYFRPPGGESWCDVILRLRSAWEMIVRDHAGKRVLIVAHQVTVLCLRYLLEELDEASILDIDRRGDVPNCGVTRYASEPGRSRRMTLRLENFVAPLRDSGAPVTREADVPVAAKP